MKLCVFTLIFATTVAHQLGIIDDLNFYETQIQTDFNLLSKSFIYGASSESKSGTQSTSKQRTIHMSVQTTDNPNHCHENVSVKCDPASPYRKIDGSCNNLNNPTWGTASECYLRFLPSVYSGYGDARKSVNGGDLPPPRDVTLKILSSAHEPSSKVSFMFAVFGLTIAHDVAWSLPIEPKRDCCAPHNRGVPFCWNIYLKPDDPFFSQFNWTCLGFRRTYECSCNTTKREQINAVTAAFDGSLIYGNSDEKAKKLRANDGTGTLAVYKSEQGVFLPIETDPTGRYCPVMTETPCFMAGDARANLHTTLTSLQTIYVREHNRLAAELQALNPHWGEERLYQEARKTNVAQLQCIAYKEFLPILLGPVLMEKFNLHLSPGNGGSKYNPHIRFGTRHEFAIASFRLHSMVASNVGALDQKFRNLYLNTELIWEGHMHQLIQGISRTPSQQNDGWFVKDITNHLFQAKGALFGTDLASMDILRGRDHGLPPYVKVVKFCSGGSVNISTFDDLSPLLMKTLNVRRLQQVYKYVEDIDLFAGLQMEQQLPGAQVGPTAACIIVQQFYFLKFGDRFYFEHEDVVPSFTSAQRIALKSCSLSRILCDNSRISKIQKNVMLLPSFRYPEMPCSEIPSIDLTPWEEESK